MAPPAETRTIYTFINHYPSPDHAGGFPTPICFTTLEAANYRVCEFAQSDARNLTHNRKPSRLVISPTADLDVGKSYIMRTGGIFDYAVLSTIWVVKSSLVGELTEANKEKDTDTDTAYTVLTHCPVMGEEGKVLAPLAFTDYKQAQKHAQTVANDIAKENKVGEFKVIDDEADEKVCWSVVVKGKTFVNVRVFKSQLNHTLWVPGKGWNEASREELVPQLRNEEDRVEDGKTEEKGEV
ncbi:hypothetical protein BDV95DRAFT_569135 [Massariosphaeria phaeospora]|uniref:Uncharacterized protein n=1 Tax=Massariosphaeria phaeospora TaxID=100035 RepID=A0A7C8MAW8_9PLEO|nr:hypothetical protein BDV95DRAFT_569135 [Massariosphaeria phaeospora]